MMMGGSLQLLDGVELDWQALAPTITDSGSWGDGGYPGRNVVTDSYYCSQQGSFAPNAEDGGVTSLPGGCQRLSFSLHLSLSHTHSLTHTHTLSYTHTQHRPIACVSRIGHYPFEWVLLCA